MRACVMCACGLCVSLCDVGVLPCACAVCERAHPGPAGRACTYPSSLLLKENENLVSLFPDRGDFSSLCSSSIFSRESGLLF